MAYIEIAQVSKSFQTEKGVRHVLEAVNLSVEEGEFVSVAGYSGSGKSTLLALAAGLIAPDSGRVHLGGRASVVFQNYSLLPWFSALENVRLAVESEFPGWDFKRQRQQAIKFLDMVGLGTALEKRPNQLSGGMRQRVAIARAFASEPQILLLDEPLGALDALSSGYLQQELIRMCSAAGRPVTALMITNSVEEAILLSDRIVPLTRAPRATLGPSISVSLPKPRKAEQLLHDPGAIRTQSKVVEFLTGFEHSAAVRPSGGPRNTLAKQRETVRVEAES